MREQYIPKSPHQRHQRYLSNFTTLDFLKFRESFIDFLQDESLSYNNDDDLELFIDYMCHSCWGSIYFTMYRHIFEIFIWTDTNLKLTAISTYLNYLYNFNNSHCDHVITECIVHQSSQDIYQIFDKSTDQLKIRMLYLLNKFQPQIVNSIPKFKIYTLCS